MATVCTSSSSTRLPQPDPHAIRESHLERPTLPKAPPARPAPPHPSNRIRVVPAMVVSMVPTPDSVMAPSRSWSNSA